MWPFRKYRIIERKDGKFVAQVRCGLFIWGSIDCDPSCIAFKDYHVEEYCLHTSINEADECLIEYKRRQESEAKNKREQRNARKIHRVFWR